MKRLQVHLRKALLEPGNQVDVILERQIGMQSADDVELGDRLGVAGSRGLPDFLQRHGVRAGCVFLAPEGAQAASRHADVGVVDMAVYVEIGSVAVQPLAHVVGQPPDSEDVARAIERHRVIFGETLFGHDLVVDGPQPRDRRSEKGASFLDCWSAMQR